MQIVRAVTLAFQVTLAFVLCPVMQTLSLNRLSTLGCHVLVMPERKVIMAQAAMWCLQIFFQYKYFIPDPIENDVKYQARAQPFLVFGLLTTGLAIGQSNAL